jgi:Family of unknown function (DUF6982)
MPQEGFAEQEHESRADPRKIVARYADGRVLRGYARDFDEWRSDFRIEPEGGGEERQVSLRDLKALFFVRAFRGDPQYREGKQFPPSSRPPGRMIEVTFPDGETMRGYTATANPWEHRGFFMAPVDPRNNNVKIFVITAAVRNIRFL